MGLCLGTFAQSQWFQRSRCAMNQRRSLQLFVVEFDTCLVWDLLMPKLLQTHPLWRAPDQDTSEDWFQLIECLPLELVKFHWKKWVTRVKEVPIDMRQCALLRDTLKSNPTLFPSSSCLPLRHFDEILRGQFGGGRLRLWNDLILRCYDLRPPPSLQLFHPDLCSNIQTRG